MSDTPLYWPHQRAQKLDGFETELLRAASSAVWLGTLAIPLHVLPRRLSIPLRKYYSIRVFRHFNGRDARRVEGKLEFTRIVRELNHEEPELDCQAPGSVLVMPGSRLTRFDLARVKQLDEHNDARICKPLYSSRGRGVHLASTPVSALQFAWRAREPYLVQNCLPPSGWECRYMLHRTADDVQSGAEPSIRVAVKKLGPNVTGDGIRTIRQLIEGRHDWLSADRNKLQIAASDEVPAFGQTVRLVNSGNISWWLHGYTELTPDELACMDAFMSRFLRAFEAKVGPRRTVIVDIGMPGFRLYELQDGGRIPYGTIDGVYPHERAARRSLNHSMHLSGSVHRV